MVSSQRIDLYTNTLQNAIKANEEVVIFEDPVSNKFVQFAVSVPEKTLVIDIPMTIVSQQEHEWLRPHMEIMADVNGVHVSFQKLISTVQVEYAAQYTEWIFTKIFLLSPGFDVEVKIFT